MQKVLFGLKGENAEGGEISLKALFTPQKTALIVVFHRNSRHLGKVWAAKIHGSLGAEVSILKVMALRSMMSSFFKSGIESLLKESSNGEMDKSCVAVYGNDAKKLYKMLGATKEDGVVVALLSEDKTPLYIHEGGFDEGALRKFIQVAASCELPCTQKGTDN